MANLEPADEFAKALGYLLWAWTDIHEHLAIIYSILREGGLSENSFSEWHKLKTDYGRRRELREVASKRLRHNESLLSEVSWLLGKIDALSKNRNDVVHGSFGILFGDDTEVVIPSEIYGNLNAQKLAERFADGGLVEQLIKDREAIEQLTEFSGDLYQCILDQEQRPLPHRPF